MAARESVQFDFLSRGADTVARDFGKTGDAAALAARQTRLLADAEEKRRKATDAAAGASLALAKSDKILADAEDEAIAKFVEARIALERQKAATKDTAGETVGLAARLSALTGGGGGGGAMGALAAAGIGLSPVIATLGVGLGGFGLAAAGVIDPVLKASQSAKGLQASWAKLTPEQQAAAKSLLVLKGDYHSFQQSLQPEVLTAFSEAVRIGGHVLHDVQPVAAATGKAFDGFLGQIDTMFRDSQWQQFWAFMAKTAPDDMRLLGNTVVTLGNDLPPLVQDLQPVGTSLLTITNDALKAAGGLTKFYDSFQKNAPISTEHTFSFIRDVDKWTTDLTNHIPGAHAVNDWLSSVQHWFGGAGSAAARATPQIHAATVEVSAYQDSFSQLVHPVDTVSASFAQLVHPLGQTGESLGALIRVAPPASKGIFDTGTAAATSTVHVQALKQSVQELAAAEPKALDTQLAYSNALIASKNDAVSLRQALKASHDQIGLHTAAERASFSAANTYISDLEQAAKQAIASGHGASGAASAIRAGLPILDAAKTKNRLYWQEVQTLKNWLDKLRAEKTIRETVVVSGQGQWTMHNPANQSLPGGFPGGTGAAAGMYVTQGTTPTADDVLARVSKGELIVPTPMVNAGEVDHLRGRIPGFAAGGIAGSYSGSVAGLKPWAASDVAATNTAIIQGIGNAMARGFMQSFAGLGAGASGPLQSIARQMLGQLGWGAQWPQFNALEMREAGWNPSATNPSSGAYGLPQALPPGKMASAGPDWRTNPVTQLRWMMSYIGGRYGSPAGAWAHEVNYGWYDKGGWLPPGLTLAMNGTGRPEPVGTAAAAVTVNITVNAAPGVNKRALGRELADVILEHTKTGGRLYPIGTAPK